VARFIKLLHLKWLPAKRQLHIKFNYATYNNQGELQTDGCQYSPIVNSILVQNNEARSNINHYCWSDTFGKAIPPLATITTAAAAAACGARRLCRGCVFVRFDLSSPHVIKMDRTEQWHTQKPSSQLRKDAAEPNHKSQHC